MRVYILLHCKQQNSAPCLYLNFRESDTSRIVAFFKAPDKERGKLKIANHIKQVTLQVSTLNPCVSGVENSALQKTVSVFPPPQGFVYRLG